MLRYSVFICLFFSIHLSALEIEPFFELHSLSYSEASAVYQMAKDRWKDAPSSRGKHAFTRNRLNSGLRLGWFSLAYHQRQDLAFEFTADTAELIYYKKRKLVVPQGRHYDLKLKAKQLNADGARIGMHLPEWKNMQITGFIYALQGREIQQGRVEGVFSETQGNQTVNGYYGIGNIHYVYHKDKLLSHQISRPKGEGYAVDVHFNWHYQQYSVHAFIEDALFQMKWRDAGFTDGELSSDNQSVDSNGFVKYSALLKGRRGYKEIKQKNISAYSGIEAAYQWQSLYFLSNIYHYSDVLFSSMGLAWQPAMSSHYLSMQYEFESNKTSIAYFWQPKDQGKVGFQLGSDRGNLRYAKALELRLLARFTF